MKNHLFLLFLALFSTHCLAENDCTAGKRWHGEGSVEIKISVVDFRGDIINGANVRILRFNPYEDKGSQVSDVVEGLTNSSGNVSLEPIFNVYGVSFLPLIEEKNEIQTENCKETKGYDASWRYIFVKKKGYHSFYAEIDGLLKKPTFNGEDVMKDSIYIKLIEDDI
jgi:hypothetical protein